MRKSVYLYTAVILLLFFTSTKAQIKFDANFESGNINSVTTADSIHYDVTTRADVGSRWFYFKMTGVKDMYISVNVKSSDCTRAMYSYDDEIYERFSASESPSTNRFQKTFEEDTVFVAYYTPYTFTYLQEQISRWKESEYVQIDTLGFTEKELPVQYIVLTDNSVPNDDKDVVWIHARTHPGETPSSYHFDGIVNELLKDDEVINFYRKNIIFHLVPFNNPDGVYYGRSRTNYFGIDQERQWNVAENQTPAAVKLLKAKLKEINDEKKVSVFLNLHSQAAPYCTFWIHTPGSTSDYFYRREYQFSNLNSSDIDFFNHPDYRESNLAAHFPEGWLWDNYGEEVMALTYETPYDYYSNGEWVTNENLYELGKKTVYAIGEYLELSHPQHLILDNKTASIVGDWEKDSTGLNFYSDNFLVAEAGGGEKSISYETENLKSGLYDIYAWWSDFNGNATDARYEIYAGGNTYLIEKSQASNGGEWNELHQVAIPESSSISVVLKNNANGEVIADAIRIIYRGPATSVSNDFVMNDFKLEQNYPNPFNPSTTIKFTLAKNENVQLRIYNSLGELIDTIVDQELAQGNHEVIFNSKNYSFLSSGVYYYQLNTKSYSETKGMVLTK
ncbi:MAG: T9SS type A sorting domain-containing protein [Melioribacteraceae bacterium]|nr:T9SS type A sorting domain-containing protein [Melioribacteraceae bacterium]